MRDEFKELLEMWETRAAIELAAKRRDASMMLDECISELKDTLLLIEANDIATGGLTCKSKTS